MHPKITFTYGINKGCIKKRKVVQRFSPNFCCGSQILLFHMCFGIRILSTFYLATQIVSIVRFFVTLREWFHHKTSHSVIWDIRPFFRSIYFFLISLIYAAKPREQSISAIIKELSIDHNSMLHISSTQY